jgi:uncharacterized protein (TIGR04222 family)
MKMENIFENPFARMYGPDFLVFYSLLILVIVFFIRTIVPKIIGGNKEGEFKQKIPMQPDPYEIAYLRGGEREVALLGVYILICRGYLSVLTNTDKSDVRVGKKKQTPTLDALTNYEAALLGIIGSKEKPINKLMSSSNTSGALKNSCKIFREKLNAEKLLPREDDEISFKRWKAGCISLIILVGLYKMTAAILHGHSNVMFIVVLGVAGCFSVFNLKINVLLSGNGKEYLEQLKTAFKPNKNLDISNQPLYYQQLQLAIFGMTLLDTTKYAYLGNYYKKNFDKNSVYWDGPEFSSIGSCGGNCSSGSSCGGGCGGCGGGCGGCS